MTCLAQTIYPPPGEAGWKYWAFVHGQTHAQIVQGAGKLGLQLFQYQLDPIAPWDLKGWLLRHQAAHSDANQLLGLRGNDLQSVDFKDPKELRQWMYYNWQEESAICTRLGISQ